MAIYIDLYLDATHSFCNFRSSSTSSLSRSSDASAETGSSLAAAESMIRSEMDEMAVRTLLRSITGSVVKMVWEQGPHAIKLNAYTREDRLGGQNGLKKCRHTIKQDAYTRIGWTRWPCARCCGRSPAQWSRWSDKRGDTLQ